MATLVENVSRIPKDLKERYERLTQDEDFLNATFYGTSDVTIVKTRFERAQTLLLK